MVNEIGAAVLPCNDSPVSPREEPTRRFMNPCVEIKMLLCLHQDVLAMRPSLATPFAMNPPSVLMYSLAAVGFRPFRILLEGFR